VAAPLRIGTCSFADKALTQHWYPKGLPAKERLPWYAEHFSTVEIDSTFYAIPSESVVQGWAERTPPGFTIHIKAFGVMTRHPVKLEQLPPELREGMPIDPRGRVDRPRPDQRAAIFREFLAALEPLRAAGKLGGLLFQMPPYFVPTDSAYEYLAWARNLLGEDEMLVEFRHRDWFAEEIRSEVLPWLEEHRMSYVTVDAPRLEGKSVPETVVATTGPIAYVRFHGRNAATWNKRGGGAETRFDYTYSPDELEGWVEPLRELAGGADHAYAFFNNNNQTDGVAQAPAGAELLRKLLEEHEVPVA
jgi:uncharacterized protein YecE (DUF72 family)